jgi:signal transduction histidine kinase
MSFWKKNKEKNGSKYGNLILGQELSGDADSKYSSVIDSLPEGILILDEQNKVSFINAQAEKFLEIQKKKILGKKISELISYKNFEPIISFLGRKDVSAADIQLENLILEIKTVPIMLKDTGAGTIIVLRDTTREKFVEIMKSEFVMVAAHQLRTPASGVKWSLRMLLDGDAGEMRPQQKEIIEKAYSTNEKVIHLVNDLLSVSKIEEGRFLGKLTLSDIEGVIQEVVEEYKEEIKKKNLEFEIEKQKSSLPRVMIDPVKMKIALGNIIDNAIKYTRPGGKIIVSSKQENEEIKIEIQDTGVGILQDQQRKVFTKFFRGDNVLKIETEGNGLGLFIAREIIIAHGGGIWFRSEENKGTTFYLTVPIKKRFGESMSGEFY